MVFLVNSFKTKIKNVNIIYFMKIKRDDIMKQLQNFKNYQNSNFSILNIMQMQLDYLNTRELEFVEPKIEEDKFSPKTQQTLLGENYLDVTDFTLE